MIKIILKITCCYDFTTFWQLLILKPLQQLQFVHALSFWSFNDLIQGLQNQTEEIASLMNISPKLTDLSRERFQNWKLQHDPNNIKQAISFQGDVYVTSGMGF